MTESTPITPLECREVFAPISFLADLSVVDCADLAPLMTRRIYTAGETLFHEDDSSDAAFFLHSGAIEVFKSDDGGKKLPLLILRGAGVLGEIGLLTGESRTATARALTPVEVYELPNEKFDAAVYNGHVAALRLSLAFGRVLARRLAATNAKLFECFAPAEARDFMENLGEEQGKLVSRI